LPRRATARIFASVHSTEVSVFAAKAWTVGVAMAVVALAGSNATAEDCTCGRGAGDPVQALSSYDAAFAGRVESVREDGASRTVTLRVFRSWKGSRGKTVTLVTPNACGASLAEGSDYLVYAKGKKDALRTDSCAPNTPLAVASGAVHQLDQNGGYGASPLRVPAATAEARQARAGASANKE
jgi:hypothetical protein